MQGLILTLSPGPLVWNIEKLGMDLGTRLVYKWEGDIFVGQYSIVPVSCSACCGVNLSLRELWAGADRSSAFMRKAINLIEATTGQRVTQTWVIMIHSLSLIRTQALRGLGMRVQQHWVFLHLPESRLHYDWSVLFYSSSLRSALCCH